MLAFVEMKRYASGWEKTVIKQKREEAAEIGARTLFVDGLTKKLTILSELSYLPASRPDESSTSGASQSTGWPSDKEPLAE